MFSRAAAASSTVVFNRATTSTSSKMLSAAIPKSLAGRNRPAHLVVANNFINNNYNTVRYHSSDNNTNNKTGTVRNVSTSTQRQEQGEQQQNFHPIYVHHVSRIVLEHLQNNQYDWLMKYGLDRNLSLRANGTFVLKFPPPHEGHENGGRIWTSYDSHKKQHWLSIYRNKLAVRFLLKDHERAAIALQQRQQLRNGNMTVEDYHKMSVQKIQLAVNEMINAVEKMEYQEKQQQQQQQQQ